MKKEVYILIVAKQLATNPTKNKNNQRHQPPTQVLDDRPKKPNAASKGKAKQLQTITSNKPSRSGQGPMQCRSGRRGMEKGIEQPAVSRFKSQMRYCGAVHGMCGIDTARPTL